MQISRGKIKEIDKDLINILFSYRNSRTVLQKVYNGCEVCERPLDEEYFEEHDLERLIDEQEPILTAIKELFGYAPTSPGGGDE